MGKTGSKYQKDTQFSTFSRKETDYCETMTTAKCCGLIYKILKLKTYRKLKHKIVNKLVL